MRTRQRGSAAVLTAALLSLTACAAPATSPQSPATTHPPSRPPSRSPAGAAHTPGVTEGIGKLGRFRTARTNLTVTEPARTGAGQPRRLLIQIWHPLAGSPGSSAKPATRPLPLIVFGPGFMQCGGPYGDLLRSWASAGYVVAAVNFPRSDCRTGAAATESDLVNQPGDVSYAITALLRRGVSRLLGGRINPREIAVAGQSDGGDTVAAVAANSCCTDRRVRGVAVLSGAEWPAMPGAFFARPPVPMLFTQGSSDTVNLPGCSVAMYRADPAERFYLDLIGADHTGPYWGTNTYERIVARVTLAFFNRYVLGHRSAGRAMRRSGNVRHIARLFSHGGGNLSRGPCLT